VGERKKMLKNEKIFVSIHENRRMKPAEIVLRRGRRKEQREVGK
jgi:hypothetical protein